jgi:ribosomal protein S12 methylthiotransferase
LTYGTGEAPVRAYISTMGCPKNLVDSEAAAAVLQQAGCEIAGDPDGADLLVVGACSFLASSWQETVEEVERLAAVKRASRGVAGGCGPWAESPGRRLVLMGCLPIHRDEDLERTLPDVDAFVPTGAHEKLAGLVESWRVDAVGRGGPGSLEEGRRVDGSGSDRFAAFENRVLFTPAHTAYVKIAEGCNRRCSFCAIPAIRGRQVARPISSVVREVEQLVDRGVREVTLLSQDIVSYRDGGRPFVELVGEVVKTGVDWVRVFYLHPAGLTIDHIRRIFDHSSVVRYLELPVQHASNRILERMRRSHDRAWVERLVGDIRGEYPETVIRSEVIVGFPGESEQDFEELLAFTREMEFDSLGIFPYSREPGTEAAALSAALPEPRIRQRVEELTRVQEAVSFGVLSRRVGKTYTVLVDRRCDPAVDGTGREYAGRYYGQALDIDGEVFIGSNDLDVGEFVRVRITGSGTFDLDGELVESPLFMEES